MNILSELLRKLMLDEKKVMNNNPVKHPTLIGNMYEGATKKILKKIDFSPVKSGIRHLPLDRVKQQEIEDITP